MRPEGTFENHVNGRQCKQSADPWSVALLLLIGCEAVCLQQLKCVTVCIVNVVLQISAPQERLYSTWIGYVLFSLHR